MIIVVSEAGDDGQINRQKKGRRWGKRGELGRGMGWVGVQRERVGVGGKLEMTVKQTMRPADREG